MSQCEDYSKFYPQFTDSIKKMVDKYLDSYDEHQAFNYLVADIFETTDPPYFTYTDGANDGNIDFFIKDSSSYTIYQCKCPDLDIQLNKFKQEGFLEIKKYDSVPVNELRNALSIMLDTSNVFDLKHEIVTLRSDFQLDYSTDKENTHLEAVLAIFGELTPGAKKEYEALKDEKAKEGIVINLLEWKDICEQLTEVESKPDINFEIPIHFKEANDLLSHNDYCYLLANAVDFYHAFKSHNWSLFEWNVRYQIKNSPINKRIVGTLLTQKGRKKFHHYNNGLLITCKNYTIDKQQNRIRVNGPQIINGCQTVRSICEAYEQLPPDQQENFRENVKVQVKILKTVDIEFINELVIATNDQNPMKPRNLRSNSIEQRRIQLNFKALKPAWFFQRKDGEWDAIASSIYKLEGFSKSDFTFEHNKFRVIDNEELAKVWFSFIGNSGKVTKGGIKFFEEDDGAYNLIYVQSPNKTYWENFKDANFDPEKQTLEITIPSPYQYLFAFGIRKYIESRRKSYKAIKDDALARGISKKVLKGPFEQIHILNSENAIDQFLFSDSEYFIDRMINNMSEVFLELYAFVFANRYSDLNPLVCQQLINISDREKDFFISGFYKNKLDTCQDGKSIIGPTYEFLIDVSNQYFFKYQAQIQANPRLKLYLALPKTLSQFKELIINRNESISKLSVDWKQEGKSFFESLPNI
jgi:hypothetical protein